MASPEKGREDLIGLLISGALLQSAPTAMRLGDNDDIDGASLRHRLLP